MKIKRKIVALISVLFIIFQVSGGVFVAAATEAEEVPPPPDDPDYYLQTFIITSYYSPLLDQNHYVTGSYDGDRYLNGNGTNGADGTPVYAGMVAAPKTYAFGTKLYIPGVGLTAVHDRGGAIKPAGELGNSYDRLDIWMGYGDEGLTRALNWGKRTVEVMVYGVNPEVTEAVYFEQYSAVENFVTETFVNPLHFPTDIYYGSEGTDVTEMQNYLVEWGYLTEANGFYGSDTAQAIFNFQMDYDIISDPEELGAGHFGPQTRRKFEELITNGADEHAVKLQKGRSLMAKYPDLFEEEELFASAITLGDSGETVRHLQAELVTLGFLRIAPTGYFGETTEHALFKFQQSQGIIASADESGAGYLGPQTREVLNSIIENRYESKSLMAYQREELNQGRLALMLPDQTLASLRKED